MNQKKLVMSIGSRGGTGKTTVLMLVADYLREKGHKFPVIDTDNANMGKKCGIGHFFGGKGVNRLDLRREKDMDRILESTVETASDYVLCDIPANSLVNMAKWWETIATEETLAEIGIGIVCVGAIAPVSGSTESVTEWLEALGPRASYIIALNRLRYHAREGTLEEDFPEWHRVDISGYRNVHVLEVPNLDESSMGALIGAGTLPHKLNGEVKYFDRRRINSWRNPFHQKLEATGLL